MRHLLTMAVLLVSCSGGEAPPDLPSGPPTDTFPSFYGSVPKNVLMISIDTFRKDYMGRYDPGADGTPTLTALASSGVALDQHLTCSNWTFAGIACTLLGTYNIDQGFTPKLTGDGHEPYPDSAVFLAERLHDMGYYSVLASTNGWFTPEWGMTQGYDDAFVPRNATVWGAWAEARDTLLGGRKASQPWMVHVHAIEPHVPYKAPPQYQPELAQLEPIPFDLEVKDDHYDTTRKVWPQMDEDEQQLLLQHLDIRYRAEISYTDDQIYDILADAQARGMLDDTLVVVWTDHGEAFWEHGHQSHAYTLHAEENDGIAFFWAKNIVPMAWDEPTSAIDIAPTVVQLLGGATDGMTGIPLGEAPVDRSLFALSVARTGAVQMVQKEEQKLIFNWRGTAWFYDRRADPYEVTDLYAPTQPDAMALWDELAPMVERAEPVAPQYQVNWPVEVLDRQ